MRNWHSLYEILYFPICVMLAAQFLLGLGNLLTNEVFGAFIQIDNEFITLLAQTGMRLGTFLLVNFPLLFLIRQTGSEKEWQCDHDHLGIFGLCGVPDCHDVLRDVFYADDGLFLDLRNLIHGCFDGLDERRRALSAADGTCSYGHCFDYHAAQLFQIQDPQ